MQLLTGINHVAIMTKDLDRFAAFYADVLEARASGFLAPVPIEMAAFR